MELQNIDTSWAKGPDGSRVHISEAASGRKGYFCRDCDNEMQAVKFKPPHKSYFRHDPKDRSKRKKCHYSDAVERNKVAKEILQQLKQVKVPGLTKDPGDAEGLLPTKVFDSKIIKAHEVLIECHFYEDKNHDIHWGQKKTDSPDLTLLAKADAVFLDQTDKPILLLQFVDRHKKISDPTKIKFRALGFDTIQIRIPNDAEAGIRNAFLKAEYSRWLYNDAYERTVCNSVSGSASEQVPIIDEFQRELFEENFLCRRAQITRLIRQVVLYLESEPYLNSERRVRTEIERVSGDIATRRKLLSEIESHAADAAHRELEAEENSIAEEEKRIDRLHKQVAIRYQKQTSELEREEAELRKRAQGERTEEKGTGTVATGTAGTLEDAIQRTQRDIAAANRRIEEIRREGEALPEKYSQIEAGIRGDHASHCQRERKLGEGICERTRQVIANRNSGLSERSTVSSDIRRLIDDTINARGRFARYKAAREILKSGAIKKGSKT